MAVKEWIGRPEQNAEISSDIKDAAILTFRQFGSRPTAGSNPGFSSEVSGEQFLRQLELRVDPWKGQSADKLDLVGLTDETDVREGDTLKWTDLSGNRHTLVIKDVARINGVTQLGIKYA